MHEQQFFLRRAQVLDDGQRSAHHGIQAVVRRALACQHLLGGQRLQAQHAGQDGGFVGAHVLRQWRLAHRFEKLRIGRVHELPFGCGG